MKLRTAHFSLFLLAIVFTLHSASGNSCRKNFSRLVNAQKRNFNDIYTELQQVDPRGATKLAFQGDFDPYIDINGGGACASTTAFNILQGLRLKAGEKPLNPRSVLKKAYRAIPELLEGRVTNEQMTQLLSHFNKYLPKQKLEVSFERAPVSKAVGREELGKVWKKFDEKLIVANEKELKMVVYQVHDREGELLGRHFVVMKKKLEGNNAVVIDPSRPEKEFSYEFVEEKSPDGKSTVTKLVRPDRVPHKLGWVFTLDTIFSVGIK